MAKNIDSHIEKLKVTPICLVFFYSSCQILICEKDIWYCLVRVFHRILKETILFLGHTHSTFYSFFTHRHYNRKQRLKLYRTSMEIYQNSSFSRFFIAKSGSQSTLNGINLRQVINLGGLTNSNMFLMYRKRNAYLSHFRLCFLYTP